MLKIFIGYDYAESVAYHALCQSIIERSSQPVSITPVSLKMLTEAGLMWRDRDPLQSNDFAFSRWLVPHLCDYQGTALFMDCDMMFRDDPAKLLQTDMRGLAVRVVKHNHKPIEDTKYLGTRQTRYERKNWSSVMLFNCSHRDCKKLTPELINTAHGLFLHQFRWVDNDDHIGDLDPRWNHLVGYDSPRNDARNVHWTIGGPYFHEYHNVEFSDEWRTMKDKVLHCSQLMPAENIHHSETPVKIT